MRYRQLGASGLSVSVLGLGCNNFGSVLDQAQTSEVVAAAIDTGVTLFDTADSYGPSEVLLGRALQQTDRDKVVIATKFGMATPHLDLGTEARGSRRYMHRAVESSLRRLATDRIDLLQLHRPDPLTPIEETIGSFADLVASGKVRYIGASDLSAWQTVEFQLKAVAARAPQLISMQAQYSLLARRVESEVAPVCERYGVGLLPYFPLASGLLTGKYRRAESPAGGRLATSASSIPDRMYDIIERLESYAAGHGVRILDVAVGGLAARPQVSSVIAGATSPSQVQRNAAASDWVPSATELTELDALLGDDDAAWADAVRYATRQSFSARRSATNANASE